MKKIIEITKKSEKNYFLTVRVNKELVVTATLNDLPEVMKYKTYKNAKGWIMFNDVGIDFDELIINGEKINIE